MTGRTTRRRVRVSGLAARILWAKRSPDCCNRSLTSSMSVSTRVWWRLRQCPAIMTASMLAMLACDAAAIGSWAGHRFSARLSMTTRSACIPGALGALTRPGMTMRSVRSTASAPGWSRYLPIAAMRSPSMRMSIRSPSPQSAHAQQVSDGAHRLPPRDRVAAQMGDHLHRPRLQLLWISPR